MILNASGRTDIVAFYTNWFMNRYHEGFVDVRNPFNYKVVSRIYFKDVDAIIFCSKNPQPILEFLPQIKKPIIFYVTLTPYKQDIEPNIPSKIEIIEAIKKLSILIGIDNIFVRYDPILVNDKYTIEYHKKVFDRMCFLLDGYVNKIIISFIDDYKNVRNNKGYLNYKKLTDEDYRKLGISFYNSATKHKMTVQTCFEEKNLKEYGFVVSECISHQLAYILTGKKYKTWSARKCNCVQTVDIGEYNSCLHFCKYCYANFDEKKVENNNKQHDPNSTMLIGCLQPQDIIKVRKK